MTIDPRDLHRRLAIKRRLLAEFEQNRKDGNRRIRVCLQRDPNGPGILAKVDQPGEIMVDVMVEALSNRTLNEIELKMRLDIHALCRALSDLGEDPGPIPSLAFPRAP